jgi:hypothetical protein
MADKCGILGQFWFEFRDDEELSSFIDYNDVGLPLAWFIATGVVEPLPTAEDFINETYNLFLAALDVTEEEIGEIDNLNDLLAFVDKKKNG